MTSGHQWQWAEVLNDARDLDIVTVTKDRWASTSAALEKCGRALAHAG
jgi:hypothetical protein